MFSFALICASTGFTTMGRSVFVTVIGDSFAGNVGFALNCLPQRETVLNCLPQRAFC